MLADERGSVVALANDSAVMTVINTYVNMESPAPATPAPSSMRGCGG